MSSDQAESTRFHSYHLLADTLLSAFHERLAGATSKRVADQFILTTATRVARNLVGESSDPVVKMREMLSSYGCELGQTQHGDSTEWTLACPFAQSVHSNLPKGTMCPIALLFLGAVRLREGESTITVEDLTAQGAKFTIRR